MLASVLQRMLLWRMRNETIQPFNETAQQVFARISALRDSLDGPMFTDQGLVNTDPRFIAVPSGFINLIPTDVRGLTLNRSPQQNINILTLGSPNGTGVFFPEGLHGRINTPTGYAEIASGLDDFPASPQLASQVCSSLFLRDLVHLLHGTIHSGALRSPIIEHSVTAPSVTADA